MMAGGVARSSVPFRAFRAPPSKFMHAMSIVEARL